MGKRKTDGTSTPSQQEAETKKGGQLMLSTFTFFQPAASRFQLPVHKDVSQKTCDNKEQTTPCVPILVSQITHTRNKCTKNEQQCAEHDKQNTKILFHCIYRILIVFIQISHKITTFSSNYETFQQDFFV